jgi:hypothetical protein
MESAAQGAWACTPPEWLIGADPGGYASDGAVLAVVDQGHRLEVICSGGLWSVRVEGEVVGEPAAFVPFLSLLGRAGQALVELSDVVYSTPLVTTPIDEGFASDLLWWLTEAYGGELEVNGEEWGEHLLGAPAPYAPWDGRERTPWTVDCLIHWQMPERAGHVGGPGSDYCGTSFVGRIGSRLGVWVSDPGEFVHEQPWTSTDDVTGVVAREARDGGALSAWPARVEAPDAAVADAVRSSLRYPGYWLNGSLVVQRSAVGERPPAPAIPAPEVAWRLRLGGRARGGGAATELQLEAAAEPPSLLPADGLWTLLVDRTWMHDNDADALARLCLACDQQDGVGYGAAVIGDRMYETVEAGATVVLELARTFGIDLVLVAPASPVEGGHLVGCGATGAVRWSSRIVGVREVEAHDAVLGRMAYELEFY